MPGARPAGGSGGEGRDDEVVGAVLQPNRPRRVRGLFFTTDDKHALLLRRLDAAHPAHARSR